MDLGQTDDFRERRPEIDGPLSGFTVVELGGGVACAFAGKWLAALGANVIRLVPVGGDPAWRDRAPRTIGSIDPRHIYLNTAKSNIVVDLTCKGDIRSLASLLQGADVILDGTHWHKDGWTQGRLEENNNLWDDSVLADLPRVCVTPFGILDHGSDGRAPYVDMPFTPFTLAALSGLIWHAGDTGGAPLVQWGDQVEYLTGLHVLGAAQTVLWADAVIALEVTALEVAAAVVGHHTGRYAQIGLDLPRQPEKVLWRLYETVDGWAGLSCLPRDRARVAQSMGVPEIAEAAPFLARNEKDETSLQPLLEAWFRRRTCAEVEKLGREKRIPISAVRSVAEVATTPHLAHRNFFARFIQDEENGNAKQVLQPARLWRSSVHGWVCTSATTREVGIRDFVEAWGLKAETAPGAETGKKGGIHSKKHKKAQEKLPLVGIRVLDLGQAWAGPYAAMFLADQGADVIKIESPSRWDPNRCAVPPGEGREEDWWNTCAYFQEYSRNKRSLGLELSHPRGREVLAALVREADVIIENFRAGVLDNLGIGYDWMRQQRHDIILISMAAFGQTGPDRDRAGYGPLMEQLSGLASLMGWGDGRPHLALGYAYGDPVAAISAAAAALGGLLHRRRTGRGQYIDLAQFDVLVSMIGEAFVEWSLSGSEPQQEGNGRRGCAPHGVYPCPGNDNWVAIAVETDAQWQGLRRAMQDPEWARDPAFESSIMRWRRREEIDEALAAWTRQHDKYDIFLRCFAAGVPAAPVQRMSELLQDAQLRSRRFYEQVSHPTGGDWQMHGWEWRPAKAGPCVRRLAPDFGADNRAILGEVAGYSPEEIVALEQAQVIGSIPIGVPPLPERSKPANAIS